MIDADKLLNMTKEELLEFKSRKDIIPITDNRLKYNNVVYKLTEYDIQLLTDFRKSLGYNIEYYGKERNPEDAERINGMLQASVSSVVNRIKNEIENSNLKHKIILKII